MSNRKCPRLAAALVEQLGVAIGDLHKLQRELRGTERCEQLAHSARSVADVGRSLVWNGEVFERDAVAVGQGQADLVPADLVTRKGLRARG